MIQQYLPLLMEKEFTQLLLKWHKSQNKREMPWKGETDPYKVWLSEVILQQTRVAQGESYYHNFLKKYPTIHHLSKAKDQEVFKLWEGLGYYNRCKNLLFTAREISKNRKGVFPSTYPDLLALKGIGPYTAAAIASFAYNLPFAVIDGNVFRVLSRFFGINTPIDTAKGKTLFSDLANQVLAKKKSALFNQAIMDFGATICKPFSPSCTNCPMHKCCIAFQNGRVNHLPVKEKTLLRKHRWLNYFVFEWEGKILLNHRLEKDIWENLYEFYLLEADESIKWDPQKITNWLADQLEIVKAEIIDISPIRAQSLTHQQIKGQFIYIRLSQKPSLLMGYQWEKKKSLSKFPFPKFITGYLETSPIV